MKPRALRNLPAIAITVALSASCAQVLGLGDFEDAPAHGKGGEAGTGPDDGGSNGTGGKASGGSSGS
ncbi:MAG TPA: hypothetical protein VF103_04585, partial [Polyangiaceae bacterium]